MAKIGVFDSGVGGITVVKEISKILPEDTIIYYGDNKNFHYENLSVDQIREHCLKIVEFLVLNGVHAVVVACSVATAAALESLKTRFAHIPIIGVIEAGAKMGIEATSNNSVGILATPATVAMDAYPKALKEINGKISVFQKGCPKLCSMIEEGWEDTLENEEVVKEYLSYIPEKADTLLLGCTHYPIIRHIIARYFKGNIVDSAKETAEMVKKELFLKTGKTKVGELGHQEFYISGSIDKFKEVAGDFLGREIRKIYSIEL
ncbi:glutamate racemase [uncultured Ilyobacter sp.]|uniref:glutamate racemase n=1 Tax=uncultured Ilyobacter sp. TaxID=544433 RepID=UPI0029C739A9|nr:glutamate racemase [uncultured Ilyobacter sp.]